MKVHQVKKEHAAATIERTQAGPMQKQPTPSAGTDARMQAAVLVAEVVAFIKGNENKWHTFCWRIIDGTTDFRAEFVKGLDAQRDNIINECATFHRWDKATTAKKMASFKVEFSRLTTIARAFNGGMTLRTLLASAGVCSQAHADTLDDAKVHAEARDLGVRVVYQVCADFLKSDAGRKPDSVKEAARKWAKARMDKVAEMNKVDAQNILKLVQFIETLAD